MKCFELLIVFLITGHVAVAQVQRKSIAATRTTQRPVIDGVLDDAVWRDAPVATDFVMFEPENGGQVPPEMQSAVRVLYDDYAIYFAAMLYDSAPDSILRQFTQRDTYNENNDWFGLFINPYNDGLSDFNFFITAAGTQADSRTTVNGDDMSLNSVWKSAVSIHDSGWVVEVAIPYISLRFPETPVKDWGLNFMRNVRRSRKTSSWNFLDRSLGYRLEYQCGLLTGMTDIQPPVRLSFMPYLSGYYDVSDRQSSHDLNTGLDLKYGINESFTLDMTLIPDFGQVAYDQQFLNLSPFENRFDENRQFFTEGTELFSIGDLLYTRRIGGQPKNIRGQDLYSNDSVTIRQEYTRLLNATKVSGRTKNNLGIGVLNAVTDDNYVTRIEQGEETQILLEPMTNYNVLVLDQRFNRNSSLSLVNTNTLRKGADRDANVAAVLGSFFNKSGKNTLDVDLKQSAIFSTTGVDDGYSGSWSLQDVDGLWRWDVGQELSTDNFDINDLGFQQRNNYIRHYATLLYRSVQPKGRFNRVEHEFSGLYQSLFQPFRYESMTLYYRLFSLMRNFFAFGTDLSLNPVNTYDYYEPRTPGRWFTLPPRFESSAFISSDYRKTIALDARASYAYMSGLNRQSTMLRLAPRLRLGDHFFTILESIVGTAQNDYGYVPAGTDGAIIFGRRNNLSVENVINAQYVFTPTASLTLALRHAYTDVDYLSFFTLLPDGALEPNADVAVNDLNFNTFNTDLKFAWWFAPASEMVLLYRVAIARAFHEVGASYYENLERTFDAPTHNSISVRFTYFLDYNTTRNYVRSRQRQQRESR